MPSAADISSLRLTRALRRAARRPSNRADSASVSGARRITLRAPPARSHPGLRSNSSPRLEHTIRIGAVARAATCSIRSSIAGSAQWMSSNITTSGLDWASASNSRRTAHCGSVAVAVASCQPATTPI